MGNCYSLYSKNLGMSGKMVWWSTEPNWSTKLGDLTECLKLTLVEVLPCEGLEKNQQQYAYLLKRKFHSLKDHNDSKIAYCEFSGRRLC